MPPRLQPNIPPPMFSPTNQIFLLTGTAQCRASSLCLVKMARERRPMPSPSPSWTSNPPARHFKPPTSWTKGEGSVLGGLSSICMLPSVVGFLLVTLTSRVLNLAFYDAFLARVLKTDFYDPASGACGSGSCPPAPEEKGGGPGGGGPPSGPKGSGEVARPVGGGGHWRHGGHQDNQGGRDYQNRNNHQARY